MLLLARFGQILKTFNLLSTFLTHFPSRRVNLKRQIICHKFVHSSSGAQPEEAWKPGNPEADLGLINHFLLVIVNHRANLIICQTVC